MTEENNNNKRLKISHNNTSISNNIKIDCHLIPNLDIDTSSIILEYVGIQDLLKSWNLYQTTIISQFKLPDIDECAKNGDLKTLKYLIFLGTKPTEKIFYYACKGGNSELIEYLLGLKFRPRNRFDLSWLHLCKNANIEIFIKTYNLFRKEKIHDEMEFSVKHRKLTDLGMSIMKHAISNKRKDIIDFLLKSIQGIHNFYAGIYGQYLKLYGEKIEYPKEKDDEYYCDSDEEPYYSDDDQGYHSYNEDNSHIKIDTNCYDSYSKFKYNNFYRNG